MAVSVEQAERSTTRLIAACEEFLDAFSSWEFDTHFDSGGGVSGPLPPSELLRDRLCQVTHRLSERGFVAGTELEEVMQKNRERMERRHRRARGGERAPSSRVP